RLSHHNLVRVTDFFEEAGNVYLIMDYLEGENLADRIGREGALPEAQVLDWARQLLEALAYCHEHGVVHRDIKPQNILLRPDGRAVLIDFGLVKLWNPNDPLTRTVMRGMGTPEYAPPEQYGRQGQTTDPRSDLYSLGATLYHALTGQTPPTASDRMADPQLFKPVRALNPQVSAAAESAILRALEAARDARWASAQQMLAALTPKAPPPAPAAPAPQQRRSLLRRPLQRPPSGTVPIASTAAPFPQAAPPGSTPPPVQPSRPPRRAAPLWTWLVGAALLIAFALGGFWILRQLEGFTPASRPAPLPAPTESRPTASRPTVTLAPMPVPTDAPQAPATQAPPAAGGAQPFPRLPGNPTIALLAPMSGDVALFGQNISNGALLAVAEWNAAGNAIQLVIEDTQCSPEVAPQVAAGLIDQKGIAFIIGEVCSAASIPVAEIASARGVLQISPTSTNIRVTVDEGNNTRPLVFRTCFIDAFQGSIAAGFAARDLKAQTAAVLYDSDNVYTAGLAKEFIAAFESLGGKVLLLEKYTAEVTDYGPLLARVKAAAPEILYLPDYYNVVNQIAGQARRLGINTIFIGADGWDSAELDTTALDGGYFTNHFSPEDPRPEVKTFVDAYEATYGAMPDALGALGYDSANLMLRAMAAANNTTEPAAVARALERETFSGVTGQIRFDALHNPVKHAVILQVSGGAFHYVTTILP
ncbi:MAG: ABC transporter substrate-binding protein, partial [Anaerolineae bacterium]|nr:ABC transporter substrate-binding protein [Anaerolineae bacterium]